jgi:hypothetical protein
MTALALRASQAILTSPFAVFGRFLTVVMTVIDVIADAQVRASAATRKYPLAA